MMAGKRKIVSGLAMMAVVYAVLPPLMIVPIGLCGMLGDSYLGELFTKVLLLCPLLAVVFGASAVIGSLWGVRRNSGAVTGMNLTLGGMSLVVGLGMCWFEWHLTVFRFLWFFHGPS